MPDVKQTNGPLSPTLVVPQPGMTRRASSAAILFAQTSLDVEATAPQREQNRAVNLSMQRNVLSTHVLDSGTGRPAAGIQCSAYKYENNHTEWTWTPIGETVTNAQGRIPAVHPAVKLTKGTYKLRFATKEYYVRHQQKAFFPHIDIIIDVEDPTEHVHVPLLLSPFGYSTYKGV